MTAARLGPRDFSLSSFQHAVGSLAEAVIAVDAAGRVLYANPAADTLLGWEDGALEGRPVTDIIPARFHDRHARGFRRVVETGTKTVSRPLGVSARRADGTEVHVELVLSNIWLDDGPLFVGLLRDVTDRLALLVAEQAARATAETGARREGLLAAASSVLADELDVDVALNQVASLALSAVDWMLVHRRHGDRIWVAAAAHRDPDALSLLHEAHTAYPTALHAAGGVGAVIRTGEPTTFDRVTDAHLDAIARDPIHRDFLERMELGALTTVALTARGRTRGAMSVGMRRGAVLDDATLALTDELARRMAVALDNAELHQRLVDAHRDLGFQAALLQSQSEAGVEGQLVVSVAGEMISSNQRFVEMWQLPDHVMSGRSDSEALGAAAGLVVDPEGFRARADELREGRMPGRDEIQLRDGRVLDRTGAPLFVDGEYVGYAWYFRDVTAHKVAEAELAAEGARSAALAHTLQRSLLPPTLPEIPGLELAARYQPAGQGLDVGGDFYDVFTTGGGVWGVVIGDVCGKGAEAAAMTAFVRYTVRAAAQASRSPAEALTRVNGAILDQSQESGWNRFSTAAYAMLRPEGHAIRATVASGGHPLPMVRRADGTVTALGESGTLLGVLEEVTITDARTTLSPGDTLVLLTDGVLEARDHHGHQLGDEAVAAIVAATDGGPAEIVAAVEAAALDHAAGGPRDDIAVVAVRVRPAQPADATP